MDVCHCERIVVSLLPHYQVRHVDVNLVWCWPGHVPLKRLQLHTVTASGPFSKIVLFNRKWLWSQLCFGIGEFISLRSLLIGEMCQTRVDREWLVKGLTFLLSGSLAKHSVNVSWTTQRIRCYARNHSLTVKAWKKPWLVCTWRNFNLSETLKLIIDTLACPALPSEWLLMWILTLSILIIILSNPRLLLFLQPLKQAVSFLDYFSFFCLQVTDHLLEPIDVLFILVVLQCQRFESILQGLNRIN